MISFQGIDYNDKRYEFRNNIWINLTHYIWKKAYTDGGRYAIFRIKYLLLSICVLRQW